MGTILVSGIRLHGYHGCLPEESKIGGEYVVDVSIHTDFTQAEKTDKLSDTVDYCRVYQIVKKEMAQRSNLIEYVCRRILDILILEFPSSKFEVKVCKLRPPMNGDVESVSVVLGN